MWISVSIQGQDVFVMQLAEQDGKLIATDRMLHVHPGERLGEVSYEELVDLGDGEHDLRLGSLGFAVSWQPTEEEPVGLGAYIFFSVVFFALAPVGYFWALGLAEGPERRVRVHWLVGLVYGLGEKTGVGGHWCLAGMFSFIGAAILCYGLWKTSRQE